MRDVAIGTTSPHAAMESNAVQLHRHHSHQPGPTLLPAPVASAISLATRSTSLAIRVGSLVGSYSLDAARFTTLSSLELGRAVVEGVLSRAARDTLAHSSTDLAAADTETVLERSLESLHYAVIQVVFWTSASFSFTNTTLSAASDASQLLLASLDKLFGSTDTSRAMASIITLIRREFNNPATGARGEKVGVVDLVLALGALAYLQQRCWRSVEEEGRRLSYEEVIWDVVVLSDGQRIDVRDDRVQPHTAHDMPPPSSTWRDADDDEVVLSSLKEQIISSLSPGTSVSISSAVSTTQTITVDVDGTQHLPLPTPEGAEIIETTAAPSSSGFWPWSSRSQNDGSSYRVVYKIERSKFRTTSYRGEEERFDPAIVELTRDDVSRSGDSGLAADTKSTTNNQLNPPTTFVVPQESSVVDTQMTSGSQPPHKLGSSSTPSRQTITRASNDRQQRPVLAGNQSKSNPETAANQKKQRSPPNSLPSGEVANIPAHTSPAERKPPPKRKLDAASSRPVERKTGFKQALKGSGHSLSSIWNKDSVDGSGALDKPKPQWKGTGAATPTASSTSKLKSSVSQGQKQPVQRGLAERRSLQPPEPLPRSSSRASYVSVHDRRRDSIVSQTDSYSINSAGGMRPASPTVYRTDFSAQESVSRSRHDAFSSPSVPPSPGRGHRRNRSRVPSIYSLATNDSQTSLTLSSYYQKSAYNASNALDTLRREGFVDGTFPSGHLLPNIMRYMRFSSACYGSRFLKFMGISEDTPKPQMWDRTHEDVRHFVHHTESTADSILLASFVDPQGGTDATGSTGTGVPLVHYISLDHEAKAVVLACRGTLGFEDVMADMMCEYDRLIWRGRGYRVHKGIHASARRLLYGDDGRVFMTLKAALNEFKDYGLVLCGHSLGAGVTSLLGVMISEPNPNGTGFVTSVEAQPRLLTDGIMGDPKFSDVRLPAGRRVHVYAYGPPGVMSSSLRKITCGLITSVVHGNDLVPHLSLGLLHDFQAAALAFKHDENQTKAEIRQKMWQALQGNVTSRWNGAKSKSAASPDEEQWVLPILQGLRENMSNEKLLPPGEVFTVESQKVLRRDAFMISDERRHIGRPARRIVLKYIKDVEGRFSEVRFGTSMLTDHSPAGYEDTLNKLRLGVVD